MRIDTFVIWTVVLLLAAGAVMADDDDDVTTGYRLKRSSYSNMLNRKRLSDKNRIAEALRSILTRYKNKNQQSDEKQQSDSDSDEDQSQQSESDSDEDQPQQSDSDSDEGQPQQSDSDSDEDQQQQIDEPEGDCKRLLDLIFVVDGSESINATDFEMLRQSLDDIVSNHGLVIGEADTRIGLVLYSTAIASTIDLTGNLNALKLKIKEMSQPKDGTNTALGIEAMRDMFLKHGRENVPKVGVVITDGNSKEPVKTANQAQLADKEEINMYAVGVGSFIGRTELQAIASSESQALEVDNFNELGRAMGSLVTLVCPTTTTPTPTVTTTTASTGPCSNCRIQNGVGYARHPTDCYQYVQCFFQGGNVRAEYMVCPFGLYWDQDALTCQRVKDVTCPQEKCTDKDGERYFYNNFDIERAYWECKNGYSNAKCCPVGQEYTPEGGCEDTDINLKPCPPEEPTPEPICNDTRPGKLDTEYEWKVPGWDWIPMPCPPGTKYYETPHCKCDHAPVKPTTPPECKPELYLPFDGHITDKSGKYAWVQNNNNVVVEEGAAVFDGTNFLRIPRFSNAQFPETLVITLSYKGTGSSMDQQALVTNGDCGEAATLEISKGGDNVFFGAKMSQDLNRAVELPVTSTGWTDVAYIFTNGNLGGLVNKANKVTKEPEFAGKIGRTQCALQIGHGAESDNLYNFKGSMDNITVYYCIPDWL